MIIYIDYLFVPTIYLFLFRCAYDDGTNVGITHIRILGAKVVVARLAGYIEFFEVGYGKIKLTLIFGVLEHTFLSS